MEHCLGGNRRNTKAQQRELQQLKSQQQLQPPNQNYYTQNPTSTQQKRLPLMVDEATKESMVLPKVIAETQRLSSTQKTTTSATKAIPSTTMPMGSTSSTNAAAKSAPTSTKSDVQRPTTVSTQLHQHQHQFQEPQTQIQQQQNILHRKEEEEALNVQIGKMVSGNGTGNNTKSASSSRNLTASVPVRCATERRQMLPRYPDPNPDAIEICNEQESTISQTSTVGSSMRHTKTHGHRHRNDFTHTVKWSKEQESTNIYLHQLQQVASEQQQHHMFYAPPQTHQHDYSYAYYEPGAAMRHSNVPDPEQLPKSSSPSKAVPSKVQTRSPSPPPNSMRALISKGQKNKMMASANHGYKIPYGTAAGTSASPANAATGENFYEEISSGETPAHRVTRRGGAHSQSAGSLGPSLVEEELRRVQNRHRKILGELNLSVEAMLMPESPPSLSPNQNKRNAPTVSVTATSGQPMFTSASIAYGLSSSSTDNICDPLSYTGPADDFISPIQPPELDSGFSGSSGGASCIGTLRHHKTKAKSTSISKPLTASGFHSYTLAPLQHCRTLQRANTTATIPSILAVHQRQQKPQENALTHEGFLTRAACGRRILNCAKIRAAEDPGPSVPRAESKARSFWNRKGWRKVPGFASTSSIDSTGLAKDEHKLTSPSGWDESLSTDNQVKTSSFIGNSLNATAATTSTCTTTAAQLHNPNIIHRGTKSQSSNNNSKALHQQNKNPARTHNNNKADQTTALVSHIASTIAGGSFSTNGSSSAAVGVGVTATAAAAAAATTTTAETDSLSVNKQQHDESGSSSSSSGSGSDCDCQSENNSNNWCIGDAGDLKDCEKTSDNINSSACIASDEDIANFPTSNPNEDERNVTSSLSATNQRNSQLRSTFSRAKQHLSFDKWRSGATATNSGNAANSNSTNSAINSVNGGGAADSNVCGVGNNSSGSATLQHRRASASCTMPTAHQSPREDLTTPGESPGGRLSRWFSIRRGSSHQYDISARGNDARQSSSSSSIDIPDAAALVYGGEHISPQKLSGGCGGGNMAYKMPGVPENEDDDPSAYSASASATRFDMDLMIPPGSRANGTARTAHERLITPMLPPAPPGLSQQQLKRRHIIAAIVHSENSYVATLQRLVNDYKKPLEESNPPVLSASKIATLFHRLPDILQSHKLFRISLAECVRNWDRDEKLGDCFVSTFSKPRILEIYSGFINNFSAAMELAKMEEKRKSALADFFKVKQISAHDRLSFFGLMVKPVQRFPQFILFLQDLLKYTPQGHHDRMSLQLALTQLELLAEMLNERKREAEQYQGFKEMLGHISGTFNTRSLTSSDGNRPRYLLREDNVTHMEFNQAGMIVKSKQRRLLLLNDKVICVSVAPKQSHDFGATEKLTFKWMYPVTDVEIVDNTTSATLSRILTAGLNRGGSLKSNSSSCNNYSTNTLPVNASYPSSAGAAALDTSPAVQLTNGADNLCNEMSTLMYDYEVISRIHDLVGSLKGTYKELNTNTTRNLLNNIQGSIQRKNEEMAWVDSCILQLIARNKSGKEETFTFQTLNPSVKKEWITELRLAQLALDPNNSPAWEASTTEPSTVAYGCHEQHQQQQQHQHQQQQQQLLQQKQSNKMPLFVKAMPVYKSQHQTEVRCGCYYTITNDIKLTGNARRRHKQQNYLWICTSDGTSSHITVLSQHHQQAGNLRDVGSFDLVETQVTSMEFVKGLDNCKARSEENRDNLLGDLIWMGTDGRKLFIYSAQNPEQEEQLSFCTVPGAVMRILYHFDAVYVALSNAIVLIYRRSYDGVWMLKDPQIVQLGDSGLAVPSLLPINMNIYAACANRVYVLNALNGEVQKSFEVHHGANQQVNLMAHSGIGLWISLKNSTVLCLYHTETFKHLQDINIATSVLRNDSKKEKTVNNSSIYVTSLMACKGLLWVGTNVGIAITIPLPRLEGVPIIGGGISMSCHAHFGPITFLLPLIPKVYPTYKPPAAQVPSTTALPAEISPHTPSMGEDLELPAIDADPKKLTEADLDETTVILRRDMHKENLNSSNASPSAGASNADSTASSPRSSKLEKQNSLDQSFSAKIRASLANSPAFHRKRFRDLSAESARICKTLPRGLGSASYFSTSPHSNVSTLSHADHGYCDVYGLYGKLIFVKEDYDAAEGTQGNLIDMMYEGMRRSDPELAAIPGKVTTLDRRLRMKAARPRSLDLSNWSVDSKSSSLYTSSGSEESMGIRLFGGRSVSRNSSSASHKTSGNGSDLGNISENGLMTTVEVHQHSTPKSDDGFKLMLADCKPNKSSSSNLNVNSTNTMATLPVSAAAATLKRKQKQNAKQQQQQQNADGPRTIITLTGGRGYWRHVWYNNSHSPGNKTATLSSGGSSPLIANSNDAHIVIWEKKL